MRRLPLSELEPHIEADSGHDGGVDVFELSERLVARAFRELVAAAQRSATRRVAALRNVRKP